MHIRLGEEREEGSHACDRSIACPDSGKPLRLCLRNTGIWTSRQLHRPTQVSVRLQK